jgi:hypothetical protein
MRDNNAMPLYVDPNPKQTTGSVMYDSGSAIPSTADGMSNAPVYSVYAGSTPSEQAVYAEANPEYAPTAVNSTRMADLLEARYCNIK